MKKYFIIIFIAVCGLASSFPHSRYYGLGGDWEGTKNKSNYLQMIKFMPGNRFVMVGVAASDYKYKLRHDTLITYLETGKGRYNTVNKGLIKIRRDTLINYYKINGSGRATVMVKENHRRIRGHKIYGAYYWKYPSGHTALSVFTRSGKLIFRLPRIWTFGKFSLKRDTIVFHIPYLKDRKELFRLHKRVLILKNIKSGKESIYRRVYYFVEN